MMTDRGDEPSGAAGGPVRHIPVLLCEVLEALSPRADGIYIDATFGAGGYTAAILDAAPCTVLAIDRDPDALAAGASLAKRYPGRLTLAEGRFSELARLTSEAGIAAVDGIVFDIGVSSMQLDEATRGFSFSHDGPLDMRMSRSGPSAADVVNSLSEGDLREVIAVLGEERRARAIANAIVAARTETPISRTGELARIVVSVLGRPPGSAKHPATRTFQALRLFVNGELDELANALEASEDLLAPGGRLAVVTFHSLEDRIVKRFLASRSQPPSRPSRHLPAGAEAEFLPTFTLANRRPVEPGDAETRANPRARSARLRVGERTNAPVQKNHETAPDRPRLNARLS